MPSVGSSTAQGEESDPSTGPRPTLRAAKPLLLRERPPVAGGFYPGGRSKRARREELSEESKIASRISLFFPNRG